MKKQLLTLLLSLIALSSVSYGEELSSLFGIALYDNAEKYVSSNYIESNKGKHGETIDGFFYLGITDKVKNKSPYATYYEITIDKNNIVHSVYGASELINLDVCQEVKESLSSVLEERHQIEFGYFEDSYPEFKIYSNYHYSDADNYFSIQCRETYEESIVILQVYISTPILGEAVDDFYDSGL